MTPRLSIPTLSFLFVQSLAVAQGVYQYTDADGRTVYTDQPPGQAAVRKLPMAAPRVAGPARPQEYGETHPPRTVSPELQGELAVKRTPQWRCANLRDMIQLLRTAPETKVMRPDGELSHQSAGDRAVQIQQLEAEAARVCPGAG